MSTRIVDRYGDPLPTVELRRRIGFLGGDLVAESDTLTGVTPPDRVLSDPTFDTVVAEDRK